MSDEPTTCPLEQSAAAYVLGALSPIERLEFERHLRSCAACRWSVTLLAGLPGLLARVPVEQVDDPIQRDLVGPTASPSPVAMLTSERRRRSVLLLGTAAAAVTLGALASSQPDPHECRAPEPEPSKAESTPWTATDRNAVGDSWEHRLVSSDTEARVKVRTPGHSSRGISSMVVL